MSDFSDRPFAMGSVVGLRAFDIDSLGRLVGPTLPKIFLPGTNEAACHKKEMDRRNGWFMPSSFLTYQMPSWTLTPVTSKDDDDDTLTFQVASKSLAVAAVEAKDDCKHAVGGLGCSCGFYAYFDGGNDYKRPTNVAAIIEGFGVCSVGTRGFRAAKARLVALIEPKKVTPLRVEYLRRNYPDVPFYPHRKAALAAHPLTTPEVPTPETAADFWTREAK